MKTITKLSLILLGLSSTINAFELEYGSGDFSMEGGFLGLTGEISTDVSTYSLVDRHTNMMSNIYYGYDLTWYDSKVLRQAQHTYNNFASDFNSFLPTNSPATIPEMEYRMKGLDVNFQLGYDVIHKNEDNFLGVGVLLGISMPWIDATKSDDSTPSLGFILDHIDEIKDAKDMFDDSKTEISTYKIGPAINLQKSLTKNISVYGTATYAYQTGKIKNDYAHSDFSVDGTFQEYNLGLYFTPFTEQYKWGWFTLSPRIYATLGYKYSKWDMGKMAIDISGTEISSEMLDMFKMKFGMETSIGYFGVGYSF